MQAFLCQILMQVQVLVQLCTRECGI